MIQYERKNAILFLEYEKKKEYSYESNGYCA